MSTLTISVIIVFLYFYFFLKKNKDIKLYTVNAIKFFLYCKPLLPKIGIGIYYSR